MSEITQKLLKELLEYNIDTGVFFWKKMPNGRVAIGSKAGTIQKSKKCKKKYIAIHIKGKRYLAHRLSFLYVNGNFPCAEVDHINGNGTDNRWINLRSVTKQENQRNAKLRDDNKSGITGVILRTGTTKFRSFIRVDNKQKYLGVFDNLLDAACARKSAEIKYEFHNNHGENRES